MEDGRWKMEDGRWATLEIALKQTRPAEAGLVDHYLTIASISFVSA
ncbi:hypothetical protein L861_15090 [Litchfieldella anticariensis FP35 = DSM 16096]|uniref:Uncharacterized protein n=1 Tax=Litchfieldella anticariensis (strain DSM 16096 / CECT 5854 / CIP 108499 / LMG 22089 / FP35) TaxID=1121939 RepID=S2KK88_LITA3|nr:hypothetical protein L861_15090 [Halomonas anticariensis FP35 = DSM 16096]